MACFVSAECFPYQGLFNFLGEIERERGMGMLPTTCPPRIRKEGMKHHGAL